jgi:RHS repeat-associated protein
MAMKTRYTTINGRIIAEKRDGVRKLYVPDALGSTAALANSTQTLTDTFSYWPYGEERLRTGTATTPLRFVGTAGYAQSASGSSYVRARHLSGRTAKWMTEDPWMSTSRHIASYVYARNSPTTLTDPTGLRVAAQLSSLQWGGIPMPGGRFPWVGGLGSACVIACGGWLCIIADQILKQKTCLQKCILPCSIVLPPPLPIAAPCLLCIEGCLCLGLAGRVGTDICLTCAMCVLLAIGRLSR